MGRALAEAFPSARAAFDEANDALGYDIASICFTGPAEALVPTDVCQPAILATSVAAWRVATEHGLTGDLVMGHSLGEYSALVAAGAIDYTQALRLVAERAAAMHAAGRERPGTMAALLGQSDADAAALCAEAGEVWPANFNCPGQVVASGSIDGIERLLAIAAARGVKAARLQVGGAFHSPLMAPAAERLEPALAAWHPTEPVPSFLSTTTVAVEPRGAAPRGAPRAAPRPGPVRPCGGARARDGCHPLRRARPRKGPAPGSSAASAAIRRPSRSGLPDDIATLAVA